MGITVLVKDPAGWGGVGWGEVTWEDGGENERDAGM